MCGAWDTLVVSWTLESSKVRFSCLQPSPEIPALVSHARSKWSSV